VAGMSVEGRVAMVTGGGRGIGAAIARRLADGGASIAIADIDGSMANATARQIAVVTGQNVIGLEGDVTNRANIEQLVGEIETWGGPIDILVNNAGILHNAPLLEMDDNDWSSVIEVNLTGAFYCSRAVAPTMVRRQYGKIVNVSSGSAYGSHRGQANYSSAKAGIIGLTRTLAIELGPSNINVNAVAPGAIESEMTRATARQIGVSFEEYRRQTSANIALRRLGQPEDVADVICFLASEAARHITGEVINVAGSPGH
jgi:3-oxoacyl-[acyl-carrier protein] reductase